MKWKENAVNQALDEARESMKNFVRPQAEELEKKLANILKLTDLATKSIYESAFEIVYDKNGEVVWQIDANGTYVLDEKGARKPLTRLSKAVSTSELKRLYEIIKCEL